MKKGGKCFRGGTGEKTGGGGEGKDLGGQRPQGGKRGKDLNRERGKRSYEERGEDLRGGKALERKGERISTGKGGKDLREERQKIWGKKALGGKGEK